MDAWLIYFEDKDRNPEIFTGDGAEPAAHRRYNACLVQWNCHLFKKIDLDTKIAAAYQVVCTPRGDAHTASGGNAQTWARRGNVHHLMVPETNQTLCGRHAAGWLKFDDVTAEQGAASPNCCTRCKRIFN